MGRTDDGRRTTDDNYKYKVLAFGACAGGDDDCKESYGSWIVFAGTKTDTCDGSTTTRYTCGTTKKNCVDVYMTELTSTPIYGTPTIASSSARDTCDGNTADKYTCTSTKTSCTDVFSDVSGTIGSAYYLPSATVCRATCTAGGYTDNSATGGSSSKDTIESQGINAFCADLMAANPTKTECSGCVKWQDYAYGGGTHRAYTCKAQRYSRSVSCEGLSSTIRNYRNVTCCGKGSTSTVVGGQTGGGVVDNIVSGNIAGGVSLGKTK